MYQDIALLNEEGYEVMILQHGHYKAYYIADRSFSLPELKILIDAVQAASFITGVVLPVDGGFSAYSGV